MSKYVELGRVGKGAGLPSLPQQPLEVRTVYPDLNLPLEGWVRHHAEANNIMIRVEDSAEPNRVMAN